LEKFDKFLQANHCDNVQATCKKLRKDIKKL
jgi:hypothetical protein